MNARPALSTGGSQRGYLIPIGGAEEKEIHPVILRRYVELCGGNKANIVVIPTASRLADTGSLYVELFEKIHFFCAHWNFIKCLPAFTQNYF